MYGKVSELTNQLAYLQDTTNIILSDVGGMQSSIEKTLEEEASMVEDYSIEVKDMDFARHEYKVEVSVIPKEYTDNTTMSIYFGTTECPLKADGYMFKGNITLPLNKTFNGNVTFLLANGKKKTTEVVEDFEEFIHRVSGQSFEFQEPKDDDKELYCVFGLGRIPFDKIASTGTQSLMLLYYWLKQMTKASFVFIDEFDAFYHFRLSYEVCKTLFSLPCQAFTSSHNTYLMTNDLLRPDCNFILQDNKIKPLSDCTQNFVRLPDG